MREWLLERNIKQQARRDAEAGVEANLDHLVASLIGAKPRAVGEVEDSILLAAESQTHAIAALDDEIAALDQQLGRARSRVAMAAICVVAFCGEAIASNYALLALGFTVARERLALSLSVAAAAMLLAAAVTWVERMTSSMVLRLVLRALVVALYGLLALAGAWLRTNIDDSEIDPATFFATFLVLGVATGTPAIAAHLAAGKYSETRALVAARAVAVRERRRILNARDRAQADRVRSERDASEWELRGQRARSIYLLEYRRCLAELAASRATSGRAR